MSTPFQLQDRELAGFDLAAVKLPDGRFRLHGSDRMIPEFPKEITLLGATYMLENIIEGAPYKDGVWVNAIYV